MRSLTSDNYTTNRLNIAKLSTRIDTEANRETVNNNAIYDKISAVRTELWNRETANNSEMWSAISNLSGRITTEANRETANNNEIWNAISNVGKRVDTEANRETVNNNAIWDRLTKLGRDIEFEHDRQTTNNNAIYAHVAGVKKELWDRETVNTNSIWEELTKLGRSIEFEHDRQTTNNNAIYAHVAGVKKELWDRETVNNTAFWEAINENKKDIAFEKERETANNEAFWKEINLLKAVDVAQAVWNTAQSKRIGDLEEADTELVKAIKTESDERIAKDSELASALLNESDDRKASDTAIGLKLVSIDDEIAKINKRIDNLSFDFSDVGIIAAINSLKSNNENLWNADHYDGGSVGENDGKAVRLFKNQFQGLKTHYAGIMRNYFDMDDQNSAIYRLRYSIVAGFEETKDMLLEWFTHLLESSNTTNSHLSSVNTWLELQHGHFKKIYEVLCIITDWLKLIYDKPPPIVNVTVPEVTLSEGGNDWLKTLIETMGSVMETAIKTLGSVLESAIGEVGQLLRDLLKFLDGLIDDLIRLVVPENFDFLDKDFGSLKGKFDVKFGDILNIGGKIKDTFTPNKKDFFKAISFTFMGAKFEPGSSGTDLYVPMFRLATQVLIWLYVAWFAYEKATGKGDLINDN